MSVNQCIWCSNDVEYPVLCPKDCTYKITNKNAEIVSLIGYWANTTCATAHTLTECFTLSVHQCEHSWMRIVCSSFNAFLWLSMMCIHLHGMFTGASVQGCKHICLTSGVVPNSNALGNSADISILGDLRFTNSRMDKQVKTCERRGHECGKLYQSTHIRQIRIIFSTSHNFVGGQHA